MRRHQARRRPAGVQNIFMVGSGKGGVGKTTVSTNLALALSRLGCNVGLLDADLYGPNVALLLGIRRTKEADASSWQEFIPVVSTGHAGDRSKIPSIKRYGLNVMSAAFLLGDAQAPRIGSNLIVGKVVESLLHMVDWGAADTIVVDLPPASDEPLATIVLSTEVSGGIVITTPQDIDRLDAKREIRRFSEVGLPVLGFVENMSYFVCGHCGERQDVFHRGNLYSDLKVPLLGKIPLDPEISARNDSGRPVVTDEKDSPAKSAFLDLAHQVWQVRNI